MYYGQQQQNMYANYPYMAYQPQQQMQQQSMQQLPHYEVIRVNGKPGVDAFQMGPNSSVLLLDETANVVWFVQTDGAGYKTPTPFTIVPFEEKSQVDVNDLSSRLAALEEVVLQMQGGKVNDESNISVNAEKRQQRRSNGQQSTK